MNNLYQSKQVLKHPDQTTELGELYITAYRSDPLTLSIVEFDVVLSPRMSDMAVTDLRKSGISPDDLRTPRTAISNIQAAYEACAFQQVQHFIVRLIDTYKKATDGNTITTAFWFNRETHNIPRYRKRLIAIFKQLGFKKVDGTDDQWVWNENQPTENPLTVKLRNKQR